MYNQMIIFALVASVAVGQNRVQIPAVPEEKVSRGLSYYENILKDNPALPEAHFGAGHSAYTIENFGRNPTGL